MAKRQPRIYEELRKAIRESGMTPHAVAISAGVRPEQLYRFLSGKRGLGFPSVGRICDVLGLDLIKRNSN